MHSDHYLYVIPITITCAGNGQNTLLITVPTFDLQHSCVLVSLECKEIVFTFSLPSPHINPELHQLKEEVKLIAEEEEINVLMGDLDDKCEPFNMNCKQ